VTVAIDTSVAVPLLVRSHRDHADVVRWWDGQQVALSGHALAETYSVLTRLPGDARLAPSDAARLLMLGHRLPMMPSASRSSS
jgi:predicted nucleic acid-binding protein